MKYAENRKDTPLQPLEKCTVLTLYFLPEQEQLLPDLIIQETMPYAAVGV